jgi:hypothetical protein
VARKTVVLFSLIIHQPLVIARMMGIVTILAAILCHIRKSGMGPWIGPVSVPGSSGIAVGGAVPVIPVMATVAEFRELPGNYKEHISEVPVRIMTRGTLHPPVPQRYGWMHRSGILQLTVSGRQAGGIVEGDRMVVGQIGG